MREQVSVRVQPHSTRIGLDYNQDAAPAAASPPAPPHRLVPAGLHEDGKGGARDAAAELRPRRKHGVRRAPQQAARVHLRGSGRRGDGRAHAAGDMRVAPRGAQGNQPGANALWAVSWELQSSWTQSRARTCSASPTWNPMCDSGMATCTTLPAAAAWGRAQQAAAHYSPGRSAAASCSTGQQLHGMERHTIWCAGPAPARSLMCRPACGSGHAVGWPEGVRYMADVSPVRLPLSKCCTTTIRGAGGGHVCAWGGQGLGRRNKFGAYCTAASASYHKHTLTHPHQLAAPPSPATAASAASGAK